MRILEENDINYSIEDIVDVINDELGFSAVRVTNDRYLIRLTGSYKLYLDFLEEIEVTLKLSSSEIDISNGTSEVEALVTACESSIEIVDIIERMTGGTPADDYS